MNGILQKLHSQSKAFHIIVTTMVVGTMAWIDYLTGPEFSLSIFYVIPIILGIWFVSGRFGFAISILSAFVWLLADLGSSSTHSHLAAHYWNSIVRMAVFLVIAWLFNRLRTSKADLEQTVQLRTAALDLEIERRKQLERELLSTADQERERIGRDLHDSLGQHLAGIAAASSSLQSKSHYSSVDDHDISKLSLLASQAIAELRLLARGLYPAALELGGLSAALDQLCSSVRATSGINCRFLGERAVVIQDRHVAVQIFRIAQEAVNNALKHARPHHLLVSLVAEEALIRLIVKDDGGGLPPKGSRSEGMGLHIMAYRASLIGASLDLEPDPDGGTLITCTFAEPNPTPKPQRNQMLYAEIV